MIVKFITVYVKPGHRAEYLAAQQIWNTETARAPGYLGCYCGSAANEPDIVRVWITWRSRTDLDRFMAEDHDRIAKRARADDHYERIEVRILDEVFSDLAS